ncbi:MAG: bifunctional riboflavin kinase/FAD synthetase [Rhodospirillales bacterium]|nr:bifunctional riboflavin kinase/FAD synthetase [Rhodospirillales bacterium]
MRLYRHSRSLPPEARGAVLAIGNFDGLHRGHRAVIAAARREAAAQGRASGVLTFEPHPRQVFEPELPPFRLTPFRTKVRMLQGLGLDLLYVLAFRKALYSLPAEAFVERILVEGLGVGHVVVGDNFHFGAGRSGDPLSLQRSGAALGFGATVIGRAGGAGGAYSSTALRRRLRDGDMAGAAAILGQPWELRGRVLHGARRGRALGMPTANIDLGTALRPAYGVYAVRAALDDPGRPSWHAGVANLGISPMFAYDRPLLEAHLFDFAGDLYGRRLRVQLVERLRPERSFDGLPALMAQMQADGEAARQALARGKCPAATGCRDMGR